MNTPPWQMGRLALSLTTRPGQFLAEGCTVVVAIDGQRCNRPWGNHLFELAPGNHHVHVHFEYISKNTNAAELWVPIWAGFDTFVRYQTATFIFSSGSLAVVGQQPFPPR